ncbi:MAG TPA: type III-B CRISPR module-associated Cmr3 family protein [Rectinema sp.]|nr:type III-B CRISPR module-associated Cmr3 family protein [Rectinema sp.]
MNAYEFVPLDSLFFRGNGPMEAGQLPSISLFPPPLSVFYGAMRTAVLRQRQISFSDYNNGNIENDVEQCIGKATDPYPPYSIVALLLRKNNTIYAPAPYTWYRNKGDENRSHGDTTRVFQGFLLDQKTIDDRAVSVSSQPIFWMKGKEPQSLGGAWIALDVLQKSVSKGGFIELREKIDLLSEADFLDREDRVGISLLEADTGKPTRNAQEGQLYAAAHIRLHDGVSLIVVTNRETGLDYQGLVLLGGEKRVSRYWKVDSPLHEAEIELQGPDTEHWYEALVPLKVTQQLVDACIASQKPYATAGWDLARHFHKKTTYWLPAGSVFNTSIQNQYAQAAVPLKNSL